MRIKLGIIFGGTGPEHEASLSSAKAVLDHLDPDRYEVIQFAIEKSGHWLTGPNAWQCLYADADNSQQAHFDRCYHFLLISHPIFSTISLLHCLYYS